MVKRGFIVCVLGITLASGIILIAQLTRSPEINDFESCAAKYPVRESYPEVCGTPGGKTFTNPAQQAPLPPN